MTKRRLESISRSVARIAGRRCRLVVGDVAGRVRPGGKSMSFREVFCEHFYVTTSGNFSNPALMCCVMELGIDRILFAVDWPFVPNKPGVAWIDTIPLCDEDKIKILSSNAQRLFRL